MNQRNKEVEAAKLRSEDKVLKDLKREYTEAANRVKEKIKGLAEREQSKSVIYQKRYQEQLLNQINSALNSLDTVNTVSDYLKDSYYNGFMGSLYDIQGQGIPVIVPFDQKAITKMTSTTSDGIKLSKKIYSHVTALKNRVRKEVSIGIASGEMYDQVAARIDRVANIGFNNAYRIARTEGHRVSQASALEAMQAAKDSGADVVKQWDSTLDGRTRKEHRKLDGQIVELDQPFRVSGRKAMHPSGFGRPELDINCRCTMTQRAKWALDDDELDELKQRAKYFKLDKSDSFADFKKNYLKAAEKVEQVEFDFSGEKMKVKEKPKPKPKAEPKPKTQYTDDEIKALEYYVSGEGMDINNLLRKRGQWSYLEQSYKNEDGLKKYKNDLLQVTKKKEVTQKKLYRSVDATAVFGNLTALDFENLQSKLVWGFDPPQNVKGKIENLINKTKEKVITDAGFLSTSKDKDLTLDFDYFTGADYPIVIEFDVPKGIKGVDVEKANKELEQRMEQKEVLLAPNVQYQITEITEERGTIYVKAKILKQGT